MKSKVLNYGGWMIVWVLIFYFVYTNALRYLNPDFAMSTRKPNPFAPVLVVHIVGGIAALLIGPFQFSTSLRLKHTLLHRNLGKVYLCAVLVSGLTAAYLSIFDNIIRKHEFAFGTGIFGLALAWFITSGMAFFAIKNHNIFQHKEWMIRCYVVTFGFVTFRLILFALLPIDGFPFKKDLGGVAAWACWSIPLLFTEWILQAQKITQRFKKQAPLSEVQLSAIPVPVSNNG